MKLRDRFNAPPIREVEDHEYNMALPSEEPWYLVPVDAARSAFHDGGMMVVFKSQEGLTAYSEYVDFEVPVARCLERRYADIVRSVNHSRVSESAALFDKPTEPYVIYRKGVL